MPGFEPGSTDRESDMMDRTTPHERGRRGDRASVFQGTLPVLGTHLWDDDNPAAPRRMSFTFSFDSVDMAPVHFHFQSPPPLAWFICFRWMVRPLGWG